MGVDFGKPEQGSYLPDTNGDPYFLVVVKNIDDPETIDGVVELMGFNSDERMDTLSRILLNLAQSI